MQHFVVIFVEVIFASQLACKFIKVACNISLNIFVDWRRDKLKTLSKNFDFAICDKFITCFEACDIVVLFLRFFRTDWSPALSFDLRIFANLLKRRAMAADMRNNVSLFKLDWSYLPLLYIEN